MLQMKIHMGMFHQGQNLANGTKPGLTFSTLNLGIFIYTLLLCSLQKQPNLKLQTQPKQLLGYLPLAFALPSFTQ